MSILADTKEWVLRRVKRPAVPTDRDEYLRLQTVDGATFEEDNERWAEGQRRYLRAIVAELPRDGRIIDCACGDGIGLDELRALGFNDLVGIEIQVDKAAHTRRRGFTVLELDMHDLGEIETGSVAGVLSSHTLEHALDPSRVVAEFHRVLRPGGYMHIVLPFPDPGTHNRHIHVAKYQLGTDRKGNEAGVARFFTERGFTVTDTRTDDYREPELWLSLQRTP